MIWMPSSTKYFMMGGAEGNGMFALLIAGVLFFKQIVVALKTGSYRAALSNIKKIFATNVAARQRLDCRHIFQK
jgi:hypothetical protein